MSQAKLPAPIFQKTGIFTITLSRPQKGVEKITQGTAPKTEDRIFEILKASPHANRTEIALALGDISENGVKYQLSKLKNQGRIKRVGSTKSGFWKINGQ